MTYVSVDLAAGQADFLGQTVAVVVPVLVHEASGAIVWQSHVAVPLSLGKAEWLPRCTKQLTVVRKAMEVEHLEYISDVDWWMLEPGDDPDWPEGLRA